MNLVFMGTPQISQIILEKLYYSKHKVAAVICNLDKPSGRGKKMQVPATKMFALKHNIPCYQFKKISLEGVEILKNLKADIFVTAAFGQILSEEILNIAPKGVINVHLSLLPKYRGAAPVQYALLNGEEKTGVTIMKTSLGVDEGDIILQKEINIDSEENAGSLMNKLAPVGGDLVIEVLNLIENEKQVFVKQDNSQATFTRPLKKEKAFIDFSKDAFEIVNFIRAYNPNPCAKFLYKDQLFKVYEAKVSDKFKVGGNFGEVVCSNSKDGLFISCKDSALEITLFQPAGNKVMTAKQYLNGNKIEIGKILNG